MAPLKPIIVMLIKRLSCEHYLGQKTFDTEYTDKVFHHCVFSHIILNDRIEQGHVTMITLIRSLSSMCSLMQFLIWHSEQMNYDTEYTDKVSHRCVYSRVVLNHQA